MLTPASLRATQNLDRLCLSTINTMLRNIIYLGHMPQLMSSSVSYKNHKRYKKDKSEWVIVYNTHEPIISQELWDRVEARRSSLAQGRKRLKTGFTHPLSGFLICADCGCKMKQNTSVHGNKRFYRSTAATICVSENRYASLTISWRKI